MLFPAAGQSPETGLRPEPQNVGTLAAGAACEKFDAESKSRRPYGKCVFDRHSTQSAIAARLRRAIKESSELAVDGAVYQNVAPVYKLGLMIRKCLSVGQELCIRRPAANPHRAWPRRHEH